jgi:hypothetical protein
MRPDMASTEAGIWVIAAPLSSTGVALGERLPRQQADGRNFSQNQHIIERITGAIRRSIVRFSGGDSLQPRGLFP